MIPLHLARIRGGMANPPLRCAVLVVQKHADRKKRNLANVNKVLPHEVAQTVKGSNDTRFYGVGSGDVGKELPRNKSVLCVLFVGELAQKHRQKTFPTYMFVAGIILRVNHCCTRCFPYHSPLFASRACDTVETGLI